jgi:hypothetical protein
MGWATSYANIRDGPSQNYKFVSLYSNDINKKSNGMKNKQRYGKEGEKTEFGSDTIRYPANPSSPTTPTDAL